MRFGLLLAFFVGTSACGTAYAQRAGNNIVLLGYGEVLTLDNSHNLHTVLDTSAVTAAAGIQSPFDSPGTASSVSDAHTVFFSLTHFFTDHIVMSTAGGIPAHFTLNGNGVIQPTGVSGDLFKVNLGDPANNPLARVKQWTPAVIGQYFFGGPDDFLRPFVGVGVSYTFFTEVNLNPNFEAASEENFGNVLAAANGKPTPTHLVAYASSSFQPLFNIGIQQRITDHWSVTASATFALLHTYADIKIEAADNTVLSDSTARINNNPLALNLFIGYNFGSGIPFLH